jgi:hypothetical protein
MLADVVIGLGTAARIGGLGNFRFRYYLPRDLSRLLGAFCDQFFGRHIGHFSSELDLVSTKLAFVLDPQRHALEVQVLNERDLIAILR